VNGSIEFLYNEYEFLNAMTCPDVQAASIVWYCSNARNTQKIRGTKRYVMFFVDFHGKVISVPYGIHLFLESLVTVPWFQFGQV
jgi:hypothetical protein